MVDFPSNERGFQSSRCILIYLFFLYVTQRFWSLAVNRLMQGLNINPCWLPGVIKWVNVKVSFERLPHLTRGEHAFLRIMPAYNQVTPIWERLIKKSELQNILKIYNFLLISCIFCLFSAFKYSIFCCDQESRGVIEAPHIQPVARTRKNVPLLQALLAPCAFKYNTITFMGAASVVFSSCTPVAFLTLQPVQCVELFPSSFFQFLEWPWPSPNTD